MGQTNFTLYNIIFYSFSMTRKEKKEDTVKEAHDKQLEEKRKIEHNNRKTMRLKEEDAMRQYNQWLHRKVLTLLYNRQKQSCVSVNG